MRSNVDAKLEKVASRRVTSGAVFRFERAWAIEVPAIGGAARGAETLAPAKVQERNAQHSRAVASRPPPARIETPLRHRLRTDASTSTALSSQFSESVLVSLARCGRQRRGGIATRTSPCRGEELLSARRLILGATTQPRSPRTSPSLQK
ncbi:uncharacterized protein CC84DRAFT_8338 [Paraphaeosphaeria sporulosa]|uniref:Uncharacterized protein n=1 Tax=Paraphaeosphaeria sporulosa TaxID=1460663 RepID=A0A177CWN7_9PLEO|nr:uncharacterized protein CC84DRAFT_8338 [Paraphaeosphaeria sporulosa]OAG11312.1 hypothetical protein CC84DRAFT_8338 [Paraphaeosphaeria sporulosa]